VTLMGAAHEMGLRIPGNFSLVSFNDVFPVAMLYPPLTVVLVPGRDMGHIAAELLLNHMISPQRATGKEVKVAQDLIVRASTGPPPS
jgi:DNA-binding LacI/PurR family transcriptional regulator